MTKSGKREEAKEEEGAREEEKAKARESESDAAELRRTQPQGDKGRKKERGKSEESVSLLVYLLFDSSLFPLHSSLIF